MRLLIPAILSGCSTAVTIQSNTPGATLYVTDYIPSTSAPPQMYEATGTTSLTCSIDYFAWDKYYVWASAPGYQTRVMEIPNEVKPGPLVGAIFCLWPLALWAYGPDEGPIYIDLQPNQARIENPLLNTEEGMYTDWVNYYTHLAVDGSL